MIYIFSVLDTVTNKTRSLGIRSGKNAKDAKKKIDKSLQYIGYMDYEIYVAPLPLKNIIIEYLRYISLWFGLVQKGKK